MHRYPTRHTSWIRRSVRRSIAAWADEAEEVCFRQLIDGFHRDHDPDISYEYRLFLNDRIIGAQDRIQVLVNWIRLAKERVPNWRDP